MALVHTTKGDMDESLLEKKTGFIDNENEYTEWIVFYYQGELVHRSAHVTLKKMPSMFGKEGQF